MLDVDADEERLKVEGEENNIDLILLLSWWWGELIFLFVWMLTGDIEELSMWANDRSRGEELLLSNFCCVYTGDNKIELCVFGIFGEDIIVGSYCKRGWQGQRHCDVLVGMYTEEGEEQQTQGGKGEEEEGLNVEDIEGEIWVENIEGGVDWCWEERGEICKGEEELLLFMELLIEEGEEEVELLFVLEHCE